MIVVAVWKTLARGKAGHFILGQVTSYVRTA